MNGLDWDLDALVGAIMADLRRKSAVPSAERVSETLSRDFAEIQRLSNQPSKEPTIFDVAERVVVLDTVAKLASATDLKTWRFRADAVVTPAVYDELASRGISVIRAERNGAKSPSSSPSPVRATLSASNALNGVSAKASSVSQTTSKSVERPQVLLANCLPEKERAPQGVVEYLKRNADLVEERLDCMKKTTELVAESLASNEKLKVVIATRDGAVGCVWANRKKGVRAVVAVTVDQAKRDLAATNANTLIFDPRDVGPYQARQIVDFFTRMGRG